MQKARARRRKSRKESDIATVYLLQRLNSDDTPINYYGLGGLVVVVKLQTVPMVFPQPLCSSMRQ